MWIRDTARVPAVIRVYLYLLAQNIVWVAGCLTMASVYRPLSPTESLLYCAHTENFFWLSLTGYHPPPHSEALLGKRTRITSDRELGGSPDDRQNSCVSHLMGVWREKKTRISCDSHHSAEAQGDWLCGKTILGSGRDEKKKRKIQRALFMLCMWFVWLSVTRCRGYTELAHHTYPPLTGGRRDGTQG